MPLDSNGDGERIHPDDLVHDCLLPKSVDIWHNCEAEMERVWNEVNSILAHHPMAPPPSLAPYHFISNKADLKCWFLTRIADPLLLILDAVCTQANREPLPSSGSALSPLIEAFRSARCFYHTSERPTLVPTVTITDEMRNNDELRQLLQPYPDSIIKLFDQGVLKPRSDLEFLFAPKDGLHHRPCLVVELKNPHEFTPELLQEVIIHFQTCVKNRALHEYLRQGSLTHIPVRCAMMLDKMAISSEARLVLRYLIKLYHALVIRRQRYGLLTAGVASLLVAIDWDHPSEPGQHVKVRIGKGDPWKTMPRRTGTHKPSLLYWTEVDYSFCSSSKVSSTTTPSTSLSRRCGSKSKHLPSPNNHPPRRSKQPTTMLQAASAADIARSGSVHVCRVFGYVSKRPSTRPR